MDQKWGYKADGLGQKMDLNRWRKLISSADAYNNVYKAERRR